MRLDSLIAGVDSTRPEPDPELIAHWTRYLCVLASGLIEVSIREAFSEYAKTKAETRVGSYVERQLDRFQNPKMSKILDLAGAFDPVWARELRDKTAGEMNDAVDSIVNNRNRIAHGDNVGLSLYQLQAYYRSACRMLDMIETLCGI